MKTFLWRICEYIAVAKTLHGCPCLILAHIVLTRESDSVWKDALHNSDNSFINFHSVIFVIFENFLIDDLSQFTVWTPGGALSIVHVKLGFLRLSCLLTFRPELGKSAVVWSQVYFAVHSVFIWIPCSSFSKIMDAAKACIISCKITGLSHFRDFLCTFNHTGSAMVCVCA